MVFNDGSETVSSIQRKQIPLFKTINNQNKTIKIFKVRLKGRRKSGRAEEGMGT